jgi:hypothetical protein
MRRRSEARAEQIAGQIEETAKAAAQAGADAARDIIAANGTAEKLKKELDANEPKRRDHVEFERANRKGPVPLNEGFERIVETLFVEKPFETYQKLEAALKVGDDRGDHSALNRSLDNAESNARLAHRLWMTAKVERERWEIENGIVFGAFKHEAMKTLQHEKDQGLRSKQITDADMETMCMVLFPVEYKEQEIKRKKVKATEESMANLAEVWLSRCRSLNAMLSKSR